MIDISIYTPVYNGAKFAKRCIDSVLSQNFNGTWEWIIVDDGSTDDTLKVIEEYNDERIKLIHSEHVGIVDASNLALDNCNGKYCARIDIDDVMLPNRLQLQYDFMENNPEYGFVCGKAKIIDDKHPNVFTEYLSPNNHEVSKQALLHSTPIVHSTIMFRNDLNLRYDKEWEWAEDTALYLKYVSNGGRIFCLNAYVSEWHSHKDQTSKSQEKDSQGIRNKLKRYYFFKDFKKVDINLFKHIKKGS